MTIKDKIKAQKEYCQANDIPCFAPSDGRCYSCSSQIYNRISYKKAAEELIVSCPYCNYSYCD